MRINLLTPFTEKDKVKALGARWDAAKKCWYVDGVADLTPFMRWIPNMEAAINASGGIETPVKPKFTLPSAMVANQPKSPDDKADCGCDVFPWEDCVHTKPTVP